MTLPRRRLSGLLLAFGFALAAPALAARPPAALSPEQQALVERAEAYINAIGTLKARFLQVAPDGSYAEGDAYLARPGRLRLEYDPPTPILVVADGRFLIYHDKELKQTSWLNLNSTPAGILVSPNVSLNGKQVRTVGVERAAGVVSIRLVQVDDPGVGEMTLVFTEEPFALKQWRVTDPQGAATTVSLFDTRTGMALDNKLFRFVDPNFLAPPN